jgi:hypothetical protein
LESAQQPSNGLEMYSEEWMTNLIEQSKIARRLWADKNNQGLIQQLTESGRKLGWVVPIKK